MELESRGAQAKIFLKRLENSRIEAFNEKDLIDYNKKRIRNFIGKRELEKIKRQVALQNNMALAQLKHDQFLDDHRVQTTIKNQKWEDFRERRVITVDEYIAIKRCLGRCGQLIVLIKAFNGLK